MYNKFLLNLIIILFFINSFLFSAEREIKWKRTNETSKIPSKIKQDMINELKTYYNQFTDDIKRNNQFNDEEKYYYFNIDRNPPQNFNPNEDYICIKQVDAYADLYFRQKCISGDWVNVNGDSWPWDEYDAWAIIKGNLSIIFNYDNYAHPENIFTKTDNKQISGYITSPPMEAQIDFHALYDINANINNPEICTIPFSQYPLEGTGKNGEYFTTRSQKDNIEYFGYWAVDNDYKYEWKNESHNTQLYLAQSPQPKINESVYKLIDGNDFQHNNKLYMLSVVNHCRVKAMMARIYKLNNGNYDLINKQPSIEGIKETEGNIKINGINIPLYDYITDTTADTGKYMIELSAIDGFNKIYVFEPEYLIFDKLSPSYSNIWTNINKYITSNDPVILDWSSIKDLTDDYTVYSNNFNDLSNDIYINLGSTGNYVKIKDCNKITVDDTKIKIKNENQLLTINSICIEDKAGNKGPDIITNKTYLWDKTPPVISISQDTDINKYYRSPDTVKFDITDTYPGDLIIEGVKINITGDSTDYIPKFYAYPVAGKNYVIVKLDVLNGKEGAINIKIKARDEAGNKTANQFQFNFDDKFPNLDASINSNKIYSYYMASLNQINNLNIAVTDNNFNRLEISLISNSTLRDTNTIISNSQNYTYELKKKEDVDIEKLKLTIKAYDKTGNISKIENVSLSLYGDTKAPDVIVTQEGDGKYLVQVNDSSTIDKVYIKYYDSLTGNINDFNPMPPDAGWSVVATNVKNFNGYIDILPQKSACMVASDVWGNMSAGTIAKNELAESIVINAMSDLDSLGWELYGNVLIKTNIIVDAGKTLNITTKLGQPTFIDIDGSTQELKIINNGGTINIDSTGNEISFKGAGQSVNHYKWFGIQNNSGNLNFTGNGKVYFDCAESALSYLNPSVDISLTNIEITNSLIGIHFIDQCASYNNLIIDNISFKNLVYAVKFDIDNYANKDAYLNNWPHLVATNCLVDNIGKGHMYCPVNGIQKISSFNNAPIANNINITGNPKTGEILTVTYTYFDKDGGLEDTSITGTKYQWYFANSKSGPYRIINGANNKTWTIPIGYGGQYLRVKVIPKDINGGMGNGNYSNYIQLFNQPPTATNVTISGTPKILQTLTGNYTYFDPDGDMEGATFYKWYVSDTSNDEYTEITGALNKSWTIPTILYAGKWIKLGVIPVDFMNSTGNEILSDPIQVSVPAGPIATNLNVTGNPKVNGLLSGNYIYNNTEGYQEGNSIYEWYYSDNSMDGFNPIGINEKNWAVTDYFYGKWIKFSVIPKDLIGSAGNIQYSNPIFIISDMDYMAAIRINYTELLSEIIFGGSININIETKLVGPKNEVAGMKNQTFSDEFSTSNSNLHLISYDIQTNTVSKHTDYTFNYTLQGSKSFKMDHFEGWPGYPFVWKVTSQNLTPHNNSSISKGGFYTKFLVIDNSTQSFNVSESGDRLQGCNVNIDYNVLFSVTVSASDDYVAKYYSYCDGIGIMSPDIQQTMPPSNNIHQTDLVYKGMSNTPNEILLNLDDIYSSTYLANDPGQPNGIDNAQVWRSNKQVWFYAIGNVNKNSNKIFEFNKPLIDNSPICINDLSYDISNSINGDITSMNNGDIRQFKNNFVTFYVSKNDNKYNINVSTNSPEYISYIYSPNFNIINNTYCYKNRVIQKNKFRLEEEN